MTTALPQRYWTGPRLFALAASALVVLVFIAANAHLIAVSFASHPDCALQPQSEGVALLRAADKSC